MPIITQKFKEAYKKLNPEQKEAVDAIEGPVMVIAGPGTGKTEALTLRIANIILKTDTAPESILALTFTESGAQSMKKRLIELIGSAAYEVFITTFHGFSNFVIQNYPEFFPEIIGSLHINEVDQIKILQEILNKNKLDFLKPKGNIYFYLPEIKKIIDDLKREGVIPQEFKKIIEKEEENFYKKKDILNKEGKIKSKYIEEERNIKKNKELSLIYEKYEQILKKQRLYDYNDMILEVAKALKKNKELLSILQEKYQYILVDEHQDTNKTQNKILKLLSEFYPNPNLFVVGDAKQAIFRFQGASLENFLYFKKIYKNVKLITLKENYRSTQTILDAAFELIGKKDERLIAKANKHLSPIKICEFSKNEYENFFIAQKIGELIKEGIKPEKIAVIFRENKDAYPIASSLEKLGIEYYIEADENILNDPYIHRLKIILEAVQKFGEDEYFIKALESNFEGIPPLDIYKLVNLASKIRKESGNKNGIFYDIAKSPAFMKKNSIENADLIFAFYKKMNMWKSESLYENPLKVLEDIVRESGFLKKILKDSEGKNRLEKLRALFSYLRTLMETHKNFLLDNFIEHLNLLENHNLKIKNIAEIPPEGKVRLLTAHKAKGQEFEIVFIINAIDGKWGSKRKTKYIKLPPKIYSLFKKDKDYKLEEDEELNIFYVALTRAKKEVFITYSKTDENGNIKQPSKFILNIKPELTKKINTQEEEKKIDSLFHLFFEKQAKKFPSLEEKEYLNKIFEEQGLSVTALNNFLECPWKYFYRNLLRIPEAPQASLIYGNAIHFALKKFFEALKSGKNPQKKYLLDMFEVGLLHEPLDEITFETLLKRGTKALAGYYQKYHLIWNKNTNVLLEKNIDGIMLEDIKLNGKIDKIEILDIANNVNVYDYKTGEPKSLNEIKGLTKTGDGSYFRQLVFYKILLDNCKNKKYNMVSGIIDFVEPNKRGIYKQYVFQIKEEDIERVKEEIKTTAQKIRNLEFWNEFCGKKDCPYCKLRKLTLSE